MKDDKLQELLKILDCFSVAPSRICLQVSKNIENDDSARITIYDNNYIMHTNSNKGKFKLFQQLLKEYAKQ